MKILHSTIDKGSVYARLLIESDELAQGGSVQTAVSAAIDGFTADNGLPGLIYTRVTAMDEADSGLEISFEGAVPPQVILGPYLGVEVDIGHNEDFDDAAILAAAKNLRAAVPELMIQRKIDGAMLEKQTELLESLSLNTLADIRAVLRDLNGALSLGFDEELIWQKAMQAAENYIGMNMQDVRAFAHAFDGVIGADEESIVRAAERRAYQRGGLAAEQIAQEVFEAYLHTEGKTVEAWREELRESAETMCRIDLLLAAVADEEGLTAADDEIERAAGDLAAQYHMPVDEVIAAVGAEAIRHHIRISKANQLIVENSRNK